MKYIIKTNHKRYIMEVNEKEYYYFIKIGGKDKDDCIEMFVYKDNNIAKLQQVDYDKLCTLDIPLEKGLGTRDMIKTSLYALKKIFPNVTHVTLEDCSSVVCDLYNRPSLLYYYIAFKGY